MDRASYINQFHKFQQNREKHFAPKIYTALVAQYSQFIESLKSGKKDLFSITSAGMVNVIKEIYLDSRHYGSLVYAQMPKAPKKLKRRAPMGFNEEFIKLIVEYFQKEIYNICEDITQTSRNAIEVVLSVAAEEGRSLNWTVEQLTTESKEINKRRARVIARTETVTASNRASFFGAAKTGLLLKKEWLSAGDNRVRPDHQNVNGSRIDMEDYFLVGDSHMLLPGARYQENGLPSLASEVVNCRCVALYIPVRHNGALVNFDYGLWPMSPQ